MAIRSAGDPEELLAHIITSGAVDPHAVRTPHDLVVRWLMRCSGDWSTRMRHGSLLVQTYPFFRVKITHGQSRDDFWRCGIRLPSVFNAFVNTGVRP